MTEMKCVELSKELEVSDRRVSDLQELLAASSSSSCQQSCNSSYSEQDGDDDMYAVLTHFVLIA